MNPIKNATNYNFTHRMLKDNLFGYRRKFTNTLFKLPDEEIKKLLSNLWDDAYKMAKLQKGHENIMKEEFHCEIKKGNINENLLYWVLKPPAPKYVTDCKYIGILYKVDSNEAKYITLEKADNMNGFMGIIVKDDIENYMLCGWDSKSHLNFGEVPDCDFEGFMALMQKNSKWW